MKEKTAYILVSLLLCTGLVVLAVVPRSNAITPSAYVFITPSMYVAQNEGELFNVTINVNDVENLCSYQFSIAYNASLLNVAQVSQGSLFPTPPTSYFESENNASLGLVEVNCSLGNSVNPISGNGILALIAFEVVDAPNFCVNCPLELGQIVLLASSMVPIVCNSVGAVYFWKSMENDAPSNGRQLALFTQTGQPGGSFTAGQTVDLISPVTYNGYPLQQELVAFQVQNPAGQTVLLQAAITNQNGVATTSLQIPLTTSSVGTWTVIAVVQVAQAVVWSTITFQVSFPLGGLSISMKQGAKAVGLAPYYLTVLILILGFVAIKRKPKHLTSPRNAELERAHTSPPPPPATYPQ
ncbi:MAG TPA: cohesin domain-containing protein [Candidatus Acidoferrales bacterium]|nr:cohesin domain-containing protein [Candidatus Acidoferrales bacterium]